MSSDVFGEEDWIVEYYFTDGAAPDEIGVNRPADHDTALDVPDAFTASVDANYYDTLTEKAERLADAGRTVLLEVGDDLYDVTDTDELAQYSPDTWGDDRPRLLSVAANQEADYDNAEPVLWDGDTIVPVFDDAGDPLTVDLVWGSYAERNAVPDNVDTFDVTRLPASMNSTLLPIVERDGEDGVALFERGPGTGEYADHYVAIAGGAPKMMRPDDVAWLEAREEARLLPDYTPDELTDRRIVEADEKIGVGRFEGQDAYFLNESDGVGTYLQVPSDDMTFLGIVRDVDETYAPEAVYAVDTGLPFGGADTDVFGVADNYVTGEEHEAITFLPFDDIGASHYDCVPTTGAALSLFNIHRGDASLDDYRRDPPEHYPAAESTVL